MQRPLQISFHGIEPSAALEALIQDQTAQLEAYCPAMIGCHVTVEKPWRQRQRGEQLEVRINLHLVGRVDLTITQQYSESSYLELGDVFDAARRRVEEHFWVHRGDFGAQLDES